MRKKLFFFLALLCLIGTSPARAASYIKSAGNYRCFPVGKNVLQFSLPTFDYYTIAMNVHVTEPAYVEASIDGGKTWKHIIEWKHPGRDAGNPTYMRTLAPGELVVQMSRYGKADVNINSNDGWTNFVIGADQDDKTHYTTTVQWHIPYAWQGNKIMLRFSAHWDDEGSGTVTGNFDTFESPEPPEVAVNFMDPMLAFDTEHVGEVMIPYYMQASKCTKMTLNYTNAATGEKISQDQTPNLSGYVYLPMTFPMKDVYLVADLIDSDKNTLTGMESEHITVNHLHTPKNFTATLNENAQVTLKWTIEYPDSGDIMEDDYWEIQRNTTGETDNSDPNWKTIGMLGFERLSGGYEYSDEYFFDEYEGKNVSYRIRRSSTAIWDWGENAGTRTVTVKEKLQLASVKEAIVEKETWTDDSHTVTFNWTMSDPLSTIDNPNAAVGDIVTTNGRVFKTQQEMSEDPDAGTAVGVLMSLSPTVVLANEPIHKMNIKPESNGISYTISVPGWNQDRYFDLFQQKDINIKGYKMVPPYYKYWHAIFKALGDNPGMNSEYNPSAGDTFDAPKTLSYFDTDPNNPLKRAYLAGYDDKDYMLNFSDKVIEETEDQVFKSDRLVDVYNKYYNDVRDCASFAFFVPDEKNYALWDSKAQLQLIVHMKSDSGTFTNVVDLSSDDNALKNHTYTYTLPHKCVDYEFELVVRRGKSNLQISNAWKDDKGNYPDSLAVSVKKKETGDDAKYWFLNTDSVKNLRSTVLQSSVLLEWDSNGGEHDYYRVLRRDKMSTTQEWDTLVTDLPLMRYEDTTPFPQHTYDYKVESVFQCEGMIVNSATITGACEPTGMIKGYLRLADGTGMGGYTVTAVSKTDNKEYTTTTDDSGYFELAGLEYQGAGQFEVRVQTDGGSFKIDPQNVSFDTQKNLVTNLIFYVDNYFVYSGNVYFDGSSIPVPGVEFKMDGVTITDGNGNPYQTDSQGAFEVSIPRGVHQVQAVKEGHVFKNDGYLLVPGAAEGKERNWNWVDNKSEVYLWDCTEVVLHGRVIGGNAQADLELGMSRSVNNLGDSIKIVMQLEGDNASYIVRDQHNDLVKERTDSIAFGHNKQNLTVVKSTLHSITVNVDNETGEYEMRLRPTRYKITGISATGYPTLFQEGKVGETLDLSMNVQGDTAVYNRIYHSVPTLDVVQFNGNSESYYGVKYSVAQDNIGQKDTVMVWNAADNSYSLGHPVFMAGSPYGWTLQACEKYYYNNDNYGKLDIVKLDTGTVVIRNRLVSDTDEQVVQLDNTGRGAYIFTPDNTTFTLENDMALRDVSITLEYDNTYFDVKPLNGDRLKGYVMVSKPKPQGKTVMAAGIPQLFDILRDPPGGGSSSYIEAGSKLSYTYNQTLDAQLGFKIRGTNAVKQSYYTGTVVIPSLGGTGVEYGKIDGASKKNTFALDVVMSFNGNWTYNYNMDVTERVQTSNGKKWVGPKADLFIGTNQNVILQDAIAVRVVPERQYKILTMQEGGSFKTENGVKVSVKNATVKKLAEGKDAKGNKIYLVRDEVMGVSTKVNSTFIHSQHYVENELMPALVKARNSLILPKDSMAFAQEMANKTGIPYYVSNVDRSDPKFGIDEYVQVLPEGKDTEMYSDSINVINKQLIQWAKFLIRNEAEKISVQPKNLVKNYDFDGATSVQYSESFTVGNSGTQQLKWPIAGNGGVGISFVEGSVGQAVEFLLRDPKVTPGQDPTYGASVDDANKLVVTQAGAAATEYTLKFLPVLNLSVNDKNGESKSNSKKIGFTLSASSKSNLNVDVYRLAANIYEMATANEDLSNAFYGLTLKGLKDVDLNPVTSYMDLSKTPVYSNFVFRTKGGATCQPYEDERVTKWYNPGTVIDAKTKAIDNPKIWAEQTTVSNVPFDEPARFTVYMANESDYDEASTLIFKYFLSDATNGKGAKVFIDGNPLTGTGESITLFPVGSVAKKQVEIYPNSDFDYENVGISFYDPEDAVRISTVYLTAHFVPTAGKVKISTPGDKWVINTESSYDNKQKKYYMPVKIEGFDVNYRGFDHIELQYKLNTQGDKDWVNVCSFYSDKELMEKASGVCEMIPDNGAIITPFYGEIDPIEQYYDLRAVVYCRHGNGFLTASSDILTGIKDTRRPEVFGTPTPINGILGIGDDIQITFSEPIASNYLRKANNFEVLGTPVGNDISLSTSLQFSGESLGYSSGNCNLTGKSFTIDMMVNPVENGKQMAFLLHGGDKKGMMFGVTPDRKLVVDINDQTIISEKTVGFNGLHQVAYSVQQGADEMTVSLYDGNTKIGGGTVKGVYDGNSNLILGYSGESYDSSEWSNFDGNMLEVRVWNRCLSAGEISKYSQKVLTGYEHGLLSYYRLNEGEGDYSYDLAAGANDMLLHGHTWRRPQGISMKIDGTQGIKLAPERFERTEHEDYTLMFWFRTDKKSGTILSNGEAKSELMADQHFNIGVRDSLLFFRSNGYEVVIPDTLSMTSWHHYVMTVQRSRNVANIYLDNRLYASFPADSVGGISGNGLAIGATYDENGNCVDVLNGYVDEIGLFASALPQNLIKTYSLETPKGTETALLAYLDFGRSQKQDDNSQYLMPTGVSIKRYIDNQGNIIQEKIDTIISASVVNAFADRNNYAPMARSSQLNNVKYSYVVDGNKLLINLDVPDAQIEKTNVYVTVRDVADLNGNIMKSPLTMNVYVYRNPLRWDKLHEDVVLSYGDGVEITATIKNLSGESHHFELRDIPIWITPSITEGTIGPLDEQKVTFTISPFINIGTYNEVVSLVGENEMTETFSLNIKVKGESPDWKVSDALKNENLTMQMIARVRIDGLVANDPNDMLAVFGENQEVMGVAYLDVDNTANAYQALAYMIIYGHANQPTKLDFRFYDASTGNIYKLENVDGDVYTFERNAIVGTAEKPVVLVNSFNEVTTLDLAKGWNWVSLTAAPLGQVTVGELLYNASDWEPGDIIEIVNGKTAMKFFCVESENSRGYRWTEENKQIEINPAIMYRIYSTNSKKAYIGGFPCYYFMVSAKKGWNRIAYLSTINLPIAQAMSQYVPDASEGDVLKSQDAFSILSRDGSGNLTWKGTLRYMEKGKGYMLKRQKDNELTFAYPLYYGDNRYSGAGNVAPRRNVQATTMNIVANVAGVETLDGDTLVAYNGAERCGVAVADEEGVFYLNVGVDEDLAQNLSFCIERNNEVVAVTRSKIGYKADNVLGTPDEPTLINFAELNEFADDGNWYTLSGIKLAEKPQQSGIYIHNGKAQFIK